MIKSNSFLMNKQKETNVLWQKMLIKVRIERQKLGI